MSEVTVRQLADVVGIPLDRLLAQLGNAGLEKDGADDTLSDDEKLKLLGHLRTSHGRGDGISVTPKKVTLKRRTVSELKQGRVPGRTVKTVNVEVRKRRTYVKKSELVESDERRKQVEDAKHALEEQRKLIDTEEAERKLKEDEQIRKQRESEEALKKQEEEIRAALEKEQIEAAARESGLIAEKEKQEAGRKQKKREEAPPAPAKKTERKTGARKGSHREQLHVADARKRKRKKPRSGRSVVVSGDNKHGFERPTAPISHEVSIPENISVSDLAQRMSVKAAEVIKVLMKMGTMATINQLLEQDTAVIVVEEMGHKPILRNEDDFEEGLLANFVNEEMEEHSRPPVVTIMGHVDHGKTSLLDSIRSSRVAEGEAGGITQHIGAYQVKTDDRAITFLDTPGHAAFTAMRARGAQVTDIVIVVVAAEDGVMPQTKEAIEHAKAANVPMIVAVNKIDKPDADPDRVKQELATLEVVPEDWGGNTQFINVSAKTGEGIDELLESVSLQAEILELKAPREGVAAGAVIESRLDKGRGPVATILVQKGTLKKGEIILCGHEFGRVRAMFNENGKAINDAEPSTPVEVLGLSGMPGAGDDFLVVADERTARELALRREEKSRSSKLAAQQAAKLDELFSQMNDGRINELNLVIKTDVQGSLEALREALIGLSSEKLRVKVVSGGVGGINEGDANLALASNAIIIGFNVRADASARKLIEEKGIDLHYYGIIYDVIDEVKKSILGMLEPEFKEEIVGIAEVRDVFRSPKLGAIAGCMVTEGAVSRNLPIRVLRENVVIYEGQLESLRRFKDDVAAVKTGTECGIGVKSYNDVKAGDLIEVFEKVEVQPTL